MKKFKKKSGFTLIEILVVIGIIAILAAIVVIAINPSRQFAQARNTDRTASVQAILNAVGQNIADNKGTFNCASTTLPTTLTLMATATSSVTTYDIRACLVPTYMSELPVDPTTGSAYSGSIYNTGYTIMQDSTTGRITITAPAALASSELSQKISLTR